MRPRMTGLAIGIILAAATGPGTGRAQAQGEPWRPKPDDPQLLINASGFTAAVNSLAFSPDGRLLAAAGDDKLVRVWSVDDGALKATLRGYREQNNNGIALAVAFSPPDGKHLVVGVQDSSHNGAGAIRVYETSQLGQPEPPLKELLRGHDDGGCIQLAFSRDGQRLVSVGADKRLILWDWPARRQITTNMRVNEPLVALYFLADAPALFGITDSMVKTFWSKADGRAYEPTLAGARPFPGLAPGRARDEITRIDSIGGFSLPIREAKLRRIRHDDNLGLFLLAGRSATNQQHWAAVYQSDDGKRRGVFLEHKAMIRTVTLSPDGRWAATGDELGQVHVWRAADGVRKPYSPLKARVEPIHDVEFDESGELLLFATRPGGDPDRAFHLTQRRLIALPTAVGRGEVNRLGDRALRVAPDGKRGDALVFLEGDQVIDRVPTAPGTNLTATTLLRGKALGPGALVAGDNVTGLAAIRFADRRVLRTFTGHTAAVTGLSESPDGRLLATACLDGCIRIYPLTGRRPLAMPDFGEDHLHVVDYFPPKSRAQEAGVQIGDRLVGIDGMPNEEWQPRWLKGDWPYKAGQLVPLDLLRGRDNRPVTVTVPLDQGYDQVPPLVQLYRNGSEWVLWTPQGYYDASVAGDTLIGWHINQGRARSARLMLASQLRKTYFQPTVIDRVLRDGAIRPDTLRAALDPRRPLPDDDGLLDGRDPATQARLAPPRVVILSPAADAPPSRRLEIKGRIEPVKGAAAVREYQVLLNGQVRITQPLDIRPGLEDQPYPVSAEIELPSDPTSTVILRARNALGATGEANVKVRGIASRPGRLLILSIGVSQFQNPDATLRQLDFAHDDARSFVTAFKENPNGLYSSVEHKWFFNKDATLAQVRSEGIEWLVEESRPDDTVFVFVATHGVLREDDKSLFLVMHDSQTATRKLAISALEFKQLTSDLLPRLDRRRFVLFLDTCRSGAAESQYHRIQMTEAGRDGVVVFSACQPNELSIERDGHGLFTRALLDALANRNASTNNDLVLSIGELEAALTHSVRTNSRGSQTPLVARSPAASGLPVYRYGNP